MVCVSEWGAERDSKGEEFIVCAYWLCVFMAQTLFIEVLFLSQAKMKYRIQVFPHLSVLLF